MHTDTHESDVAERACPICGGTGWRVVEREGISGAERCECADVRRRGRLVEQANIPPLYLTASLQNFVAYGQREALKAVMSDVRKYTNGYPFKVDKPGLLFVGGPGTGKTHLAVAALLELIERGFEGVFFDFQALLNHIRSGYDQASGTMDREAYRSALETEILVLDDLGAHRVTDWVEDTVTSIITHRCNNRKATIVTTNLDEREPGLQYRSPTEEAIRGKFSLIERIGRRAWSRLFEMCKVIRMPDVGDYRLKSS